MVLDTNILIAFLNHEDKVTQHVNIWKQEQRTLLLSSITVAEVLALPTLSLNEMKIIRSFFNHFFIISFDHHLAEIAAYFQREYRLALPDAGIAATAIQSELPLVTRDKIFQKISELTVIKI